MLYKEITSIKINDEIEIIDFSDTLEIGPKTLYDVINDVASWMMEKKLREN